MRWYILEVSQQFPISQTAATEVVGILRLIKHGASRDKLRGDFDAPRLGASYGACN